jgi:hypothetical protein
MFRQIRQKQQLRRLNMVHHYRHWHLQLQHY